jgi:hypothetical protein
MRWKLIYAAVAVLVLAAGVQSAHADGQVERAKGCGDKIFAASVGGYSVLSGTGAGDVADGDQLVGNLDKVGQVFLYDKTAGRSVFALVEEHGLVKAQIDQRIAATCRSFLANTFTSGRITRTRGCGNKIFVDAGAAGYAQLERLAGGVVYEGDTLSGNFNRAGRATVTDKPSGGELTVFVDDFGLSASAIQRKIAANCR